MVNFQDLLSKIALLIVVIVCYFMTILKFYEFGSGIHIALLQAIFTIAYGFLIVYQYQDIKKLIKVK